MGGRPTPGIGFGSGIERLMLALEAVHEIPGRDRLDAFIVNGLGRGGSVRTTVLVSDLREEGVSADRVYDDRSVSAQLKAASRVKARFAVLLGMEDAAADYAVVRDLDSGKQEHVLEAGIATWLKDRIPESVAR